MELVAWLQHPWLAPPRAKTPAFSPVNTHAGPFPWKLLKVSCSQIDDAEPISPGSPVRSPEADPVKLAFQRAKAYKKSKEEENFNLNSKGNFDDETDKEVPLSVRVAMEKAQEYKKGEGVVRDAGDGGNAQDSPGSETTPVTKLDSKYTVEKDSKKQELRVSSLDFMGLNFADKKQTRGLPPGLVPVSYPLPEGDLPEVEIIVGDTTKFEEATPPKSEQMQEETDNVYKPKVSTWGVFPRPSNISKTYGGGKNIQPGDSLETPEERAAKEERTRKLVAAYKEKVGLKIDPRLKSECEKALADGNSLMDSGKLSEALGFYERIMEKMPFKSEVYGFAALQWSICQDSLRSSNKARVMYEKLQKHPNAQVSKKARQFVFSFQAMEMMKVSGSSFSNTNTGYQNYFEAFVEKEPKYSVDGAGAEDLPLNQTLPYVIFLVSPVLFVLYIAVQKGSVH